MTTPTQTFALKLAVNSNTNLLAHPVQGDGTSTTLYSHVSNLYEITPSKPQLSGLYSLLEPSAYRGLEEESSLQERLMAMATGGADSEQSEGGTEMPNASVGSSMEVEVGTQMESQFLVGSLDRGMDSMDTSTTPLSASSGSGPVKRSLNFQSSSNEPAQLWTWDELKIRVRASDKELKDGLRALHAELVDGYWRLVDAAYAREVLGYILLCVTEAGWSLESIPGGDLVASAASAHAELAVRHALRKFGRSVEGSQDVWALDPVAVCRELAAGVFSMHGDMMEASLFHAAWKDAVPDEWAEGLSMDMLAGVAVEVATSAMQTKILHIPRASLPGELVPRLSTLFSYKPQWKYEELKPFVEDFTAPGQSADELLLKHARLVQSLGVGSTTKIFVARPSGPPRIVR